MILAGVALVDVSLSVAAPVITVQTGEINLVAIPYNLISGSYIIGNPFAAPIRVRDTGSGSYAMSAMNTETGEPTIPHGYSKTMWIEYEADAPMTLAISTDVAALYDYTVEIFDGDTLDALNLITSQDATASSGHSVTNLSADINTGMTYIRISTPWSITPTVNWGYTISAATLMVDAITPSLNRTPDDFQVAVQGGNPGETIRFTWNPPVSTLIPSSVSRPIVLADITADSSGNIYLGSLQIPAVNAGLYTVDVHGLESGRLGSVGLPVQLDPLPQDTGIVDATPVSSTSAAWLWDDGRGHHWIMDINPESMMSLVPTKVYTSEHTTSGTGQHIIWQGITPAVDWGFKGTLLSEDEYDEFTYFYNLNRKFYITDHKNRRHTVTFKSLDMVPHKAGANFWAHDYTASLFLFNTTP